VQVSQGAIRVFLLNGLQGHGCVGECMNLLAQLGVFDLIDHIMGAQIAILRQPEGKLNVELIALLRGLGVMILEDIWEVEVPPAP
jgi:hypothetical protein